MTTFLHPHANSAQTIVATRMGATAQRRRRMADWARPSVVTAGYGWSLIVAPPPVDGLGTDRRFLAAQSACPGDGTRRLPGEHSGDARRNRRRREELANPLE